MSNICDTVRLIVWLHGDQALFNHTRSIIGVNMTQSQIRVNNMRGHGDNLYSIVTFFH